MPRQEEHWILLAQGNETVQINTGETSWTKDNCLEFGNENNMASCRFKRQYPTITKCNKIGEFDEKGRLPRTTCKKFPKGQDLQTFDNDEGSICHTYGCEGKKYDGRGEGGNKRSYEERRDFLGR